MDVSKLLPEVYFKESRDFSYVGRLLEVAFNYLKTGADLVDVNPDNENISNDLLELVCTTLGFESKHKYIKKDLVAIASDFINLCKKKGSIESIAEAIIVLLNSQGIRIGDKSIEECIKIDTLDSHMIDIEVPHEMTDIVLLEDIFEYILPVGTIFRFQHVVDSRTTPESPIPLNPDIIQFSNGFDDKLGQISNDGNISEEYAEELNRSTLYTGVVTSTITQQNTDETSE